MYEVGKCPKHSESESLPLLRHCRNLLSRSRLPEISKFLKIGDSYVIAADKNITDNLPNVKV